MTRRVVSGLAGFLVAVGGALVMSGGASTAPASPASPVQGVAHVTLDSVEAAYANARYWKDQTDLTLELQADTSPHGVALTRLRQQYRTARTRWHGLLTTLQRAMRGRAPTPASSREHRALALMVEAATDELVANPWSDESTVDADSASCAFDAGTLARDAEAFELLTTALESCFGWTGARVPVGDSTFDRLTILGRLATTDDPAARERTFRSLDVLWRAVNRDNSPASPYRQLARVASAEFARGNDEAPAASAIAELGLTPDTVEQWLRRVLGEWRSIAGDSLVEPWDFYYFGGVPSRALSARIPRPMLDTLTRRFYRSLGADPVRLHVHADLDPRAGKDPVAYTRFGVRGRRVGKRWQAAEPWVFASYNTGGFDNLTELVHEMGHAVAIAGIRASPAFNDWPSNDTFNEALADVLALELYEPAWQQRFMGDSVPLAASLRAKYASVMLDIAWSLFEAEMFRTPDADPNQVWTRLTSCYLRITPHPELSWWAMRGQLVGSPGYMMNYGIGALIVAELRDKIRRTRGPISRPDSAWYGWVAPRIYGFGLERPASRVLRDFLGHNLSPAAIVADMRRARPATATRREPTSFEDCR